MNRFVEVSGGAIEIRLNSSLGPLLAKVEIPKGTEWKETSGDLTASAFGMHNLVVTMPQEGNIEVDWVSFE